MPPAKPVTLLNGKVSTQLGEQQLLTCLRRLKIQSYPRDRSAKATCLQILRLF